MLTTGSWGRPAAAEPDMGAVVQNIDKKLKPTPKELPDFNKEILAPLRAKQAEAARVAEEARLAALAAAQAARAEPPQPAPVIAVAREVQPSQSGNCLEWMSQADITDIPNASLLVAQESGCDPNNWNGKSQGRPFSVNTACGIGQQLPCGKWPHAWNDPVGGLIDMQNYVFGRYGSWANAWAYWQVHGNY